MSTLFADTDVEVVVLSLQARATGILSTYFFGLDFWDAGALYPGSPRVLPLLAASPAARRGVGTVAAVRFDVDVQAWGKNDLDRRGVGLFDMLQTHEFYNARVEVRYYAKPRLATVTHADSMNICQVLNVVETAYDEASGVMTLRCRDSWYDDKDFGRRFDTNDFEGGVDEYVNRWRTEMMPVPFGDSADGMTGVIVSSVPLLKAELLLGYSVFKVMAGTAPPGNPNELTILPRRLFVRNVDRQLDSKSWIELDLPEAPPLTPLIAGPGTLTNLAGKEYAGKQFRLARRVRPPANGLLIGSVGLLSRRVGTIRPGDGEFKIRVYRARQLGPNRWALDGNSFRDATVSAEAISSLATQPVSFIFDDPPLFLPPGLDYLFVAEWTGRPHETITVNNATSTTPILINTATAHGLVNGDVVTTTGIGGNFAANGTWGVEVVDAVTLRLIGSAWNADYVMRVVGATNTAPIVLTFAQAHGLTTGDRLQVVDVQDNTAANSSWDVSVLSATQVALAGSAGSGAYVAAAATGISSVSSGAPMEVTTAGAHGLTDPRTVYIKGTTLAVANDRLWRIAAITAANKFTLAESFGGGGAAGTGGTAYWGGFATSQGRAERVAHVTLHYDDTVFTDPAFVNDKLVGDGFAETPFQFQMQVFGYSKTTTDTFGQLLYNFPTPTHRNFYMQAETATGGFAPVQFGKLEFKAGVRGLSDYPAPGLYNAGGLIDNPASIIHFILRSTNFGLGLDTSRADYVAIDAVRQQVGGSLKMAFVVEELVSCEELILKVCEQSGLIIYKTRDGRITLKKPANVGTPVADISEGAFYGDMQLLGVADSDPAQIVNSLEVVFRKDTLDLNTDPALLRISRDSRFLELEYTYGNETGFSVSQPDRAARALKSQALYGLRAVLDRYDLYDRVECVRKVMNYWFDRYSTKQRRVSFRVPRRLFYTLDLFADLRVQHTGLQDAGGTAQAVTSHDSGGPVTADDEGVPLHAYSAGFITGQAYEIVEQGPWITFTVETVNPF